MSELAFFRMQSLNLLTNEEIHHRIEIIEITEEVLNAHGVKCDDKISKMDRDSVIEILNEVRIRRKKKGVLLSYRVQSSDIENH